MTQTASVEKRLQAEVVELNVLNIRFQNKLGPPKILKKRTLDPTAPIAQFTNPSFITLADTTIEAIYKLDSEEVERLSEGLFFQQEVGFVMVKDQLVLSSKKRYKHSESKLLKLTLNDESYVEIIKNEIRILRSEKTRKTGLMKYDRPAEVIVDYNVQSKELRLIFSYKFSFIQSLYLNLPNEVCTDVTDIVNKLAESEGPNSSPPVSTKLFYETITDRAQDYSSTGKPPLVSELDTDLLPFQGKTVTWMLSREHCVYNHETHTVEEELIPSTLLEDSLVQKRLNELSFGFKLVKIPSLGKTLWYNQYSGNICTKEKAAEFISGIPLEGCTGILSEEMGLGKTVEIVSLILMNQRPCKQLEEWFIGDNNRVVKKVKTTLIICPDSILNQWVDEINVHAPGLTVMVYKGLYNHKVPINNDRGRATYRTLTTSELAEEFARHDVIITSYSVVSREVYNASYNPERLKRLRRSNTRSFEIGDPENYDKEELDILEEMANDIEDLKTLNSERLDHSSPLVSLEFWRLVLDEVQMVGKSASNTCQIATLIPRFHSWAVSGTPIKNDIDDLFPMLSFLKIHPFGGNKRSWGQLLKKSDDFIKLFATLGFRHTKEIVKDEIRLPSQRRVLLTIPFGAIEQNNYDERYKDFLSDVGLDVDGNPVVENWEPSPSYYESMRNWLKTLRNICCHANFGTDDGQLLTSRQYNSIESVLNRIISTDQEKIYQLEREKTLSRLELGQIYEFKRQPKLALGIWKEELDVVEKRVEEMRAEIEQSTDAERKVSVISFRNTLELLHRLHFFVASAHYQLYNPPITELVPGIEKDFHPEDVDPRLENGGSSLDFSGITVSRALTEEEAMHQDLETYHYGIAQSIRKELLSEAIKNVNLSFKKLDDEFHVNYINPVQYRFSSFHAIEFYSRVNIVINELNAQAVVLNKFFDNLVKLLKVPLLDTVTDPSGEEYTHSLDDQSDSSAYLEVLQKGMKNRDSIILGKSNGEFYETIKVIARGSVDLDDGGSALEQKLSRDLPLIGLKYSLKSLLIDAKSLIVETEDSADSNFLRSLVKFIKETFEEQKLTSENSKKKFRTLNDTYNLRIAYFKQLQELSDNVVAFDEVTHGNYDPTRSSTRLYGAIEAADKSISAIRSRIQYLETLSVDYNPEEKICVICHNSITIGSFLKCGHKYCKDCLNEWLRNKSRCPTCKYPVKNSEIYNFTFNREEINVTLDVEHKGGKDGEITEIYEKYEKKNLLTLNEIKLKTNYGSKINTIVRQVLYLKRSDPFVQIVVYSQWSKLLSIIASAFKQNGISCLGSKDTLGAKSSSSYNKSLKVDISIFKKNPRITCFLLNAKADASGLNLINATHVFICEPLVNTALELQAISRIHRIGQKKETTIWMFAISGTVEESIILLSSRKRIKDKEKLETEDMSKSSKTLVETNGEHVNSEELWGSFFSLKVDHIV